MPRSLVVAVLVATSALMTAGAASGHPLGNFTTNTATGVRVTSDGLHVDRILDLAEIPALRAIQSGDGDGDGVLAGADADRYATETCAELGAGLVVTVDGESVVLTEAAAPTLTFPPGEAGLDTLRLECPLVAATDIGVRTVEVTLRDTAFPDRLGWREVTAVGDGAEIVAGDVPEVSESARLTTYPQARLSSPLDQREATFSVRAGGEALDGLAPSAGVPAPVARGIDRVSVAFTDLVAVERVTLPFALLAILAAAALGTLHAFAPGHGKTVIAAYLIGKQGTPRDALLLGGTVAVTHTLGVFALGAGLSLTASASPARIYPWLGAASGLLFTVVGVTLLRQARRSGGHVHGPGGHVHGPDGRITLVPATTAPAAEPQPEPAAGTTAGATTAGATTAGTTTARYHGHDHDHDHGHGDVAHRDGDVAHSHDGHEPHRHGGDDPHRHHDTAAPPTSRPGPLRGLIAPGLAGGLVPSPSALLVLLAGFAIGRAWFGVGLVVAYGLGMAGALIAAGYVMLRLRGRFETVTASGQRWTRLARLGRHLPVVTSALIIAGGLVIVIRSLAAA